MGTQWENFLQNLGEWEGVFTKLSRQGEVLEETPSQLLLESLNEGKAARLRLRRFLRDPNGGEPEVNELVRHYQGFGRDILFFENGAFSQGSIQLAPFSEFGAEFGFIADQRRLRFVQLYDRAGDLSSLTLIQERRTGEPATTGSRLKIEDLLGVWQGEAVTLYPDWQPESVFPTRLELSWGEEGRLSQKLEFVQGDATVSFASSAKVEGSKLYFEERSGPVQVLLLNGGGSLTCPLRVELRKSFFLEAGWLVRPGFRQRMIRSYNETGEWKSLTLVTEEKVS